MPAAVAGILIMALGRAISAHRRRAAASAGLVVGQLRRHFQADIAVITLAGVVLAAQQIAGGLDVRHHQRFVTRLGRQTGVRLQTGQIGLVAGVAADRLVEDRRIGGHAGDAVVGQQARQFAGSDQFAGQIVQPDALAEGADGLQSIHGGTIQDKVRAGPASPSRPVVAAP